MLFASFFTNLYNNLSYILYRKFPICLASVFSAILNHIFVLYIYISYNNILYSGQKRSLLHNVLHDLTP